MASRIVSLVRIFNRSGQVTNTTTSNPNSWATISAWRKFFALKEEEEEAQGQQTQLEHEEGNSNVDTTLLTTNNNGEQNDTPQGRAMLHSTGPVQSEESIRARNQFVKESQRRNAHCENVLSSSWAPPAIPSPRENEILQRPNIEIPVNGIPCTIAQ